MTTTDYLNTKRLKEIVRTTNGLPYWMQSLVFRMYWNYRQHGETYFTLSMAWHAVKEIYANLDIEPEFTEIDSSDFYGCNRYNGD